MKVQAESTKRKTEEGAREPQAATPLAQAFGDLAEAIIRVAFDDGTPEKVSDILLDAVNDIGNEVGAHTADRAAFVRYVLNVAGGLAEQSADGLTGETGERVRTSAPPPADREHDPYRELGQAFAAIERHRDYIPTHVYNALADPISDWIGMSHWESNPELVATIFPLLVKQVHQNAAAEGGEES